jgi:bifunctional non-homologous end joining protein LigD
MSAAEMSGVTWLRPTLVAQIRFAEWTEDGLLRQPVFLGLRDDKPAHAVRREALAS